MPVGSKYAIYPHSDLGYGQVGTGPIPAYARIEICVELHEIKQADCACYTEK